MSISRRRALGLAGAAALAGAASTHAAEAWVDASHADDPLPFYGSPASAIRPDRNPPIAKDGRVVWAGHGMRREVALTFDDGPSPEWTPLVLDALSRADAPATFFCLGRNVRDHSEIHEHSSERHELGNHTFEHPDLARVSLERVRDEITTTGDAMEGAYGTRPTLFRPPYGHLGGSALLAAAEAGLTTVLWSAQAREDLVATHPDDVVSDITGQLRPGSIVLAHDTGDDTRRITIDRLARLIEAIRADGYSLVTVSQLLTPSGPLLG